MPKTYTDDIGPVLPSALTGPLQVVSATDPSAWIKVDPATAKISAAGTAAPMRRIVIPSARVYGTITPSLLGQAIAAFYVGATQTGGHYLTPILIPDDMDVAKSCNVEILISPQTSATTNGQAIRFQLSDTRVADGGTRADANLTYDWSVPTNWVTTNNNVITLDGGSGYSYAGGTFQHGQHLGMRIARLGTAAEDTFDKSVFLGEYAIFEYTAGEF